MKNNVFFTIVCILLIFSVFIAACSTEKPVSQLIPTSVVTNAEITEQITNQIEGQQQAGPLSEGQQQTGPLSLTINSAHKKLRVGNLDGPYSGVLPGFVYLVLNITVKNNNATDGFNLSPSSLVVGDLDRGNRNRAWNLPNSLQKYMENYLVLPVTMKQNDIASGQVLFKMNDSMNYKVNLIDDDKHVIAYQLVNFNKLLTTEDPVGITINSARKVPRFETTYPFAGNIFLIVNVTIKNNGVRPAFVFDFMSANVQDLNSYSVVHSLNGAESSRRSLNDLIISPTAIQQNGFVTGTILFGIPDSTKYRINLFDSNTTIIATRDIQFSATDNTTLIPVITQSATSKSSPITVMIHSTYKTERINTVNAPIGYVFVVVNMTIDNHGGNNYQFNRQSVSINDGAPIADDVYIQLTGHGYWGAIPPNEKRTGVVIFQVANTTQNFTTRFFYHQRQNSFSLELGNIQMTNDSVIL